MCRIFIFADSDPLWHIFSCCGLVLLDHLNFLIRCSERTVKWHFHFYLSAHSDFGFFSCVGYLPSKLHIKNIKKPFWDLDLNDMHHIPPE